MTFRISLITEWRRLVRVRLLLAAVLFYIFAAISSPLMAIYLPKIIAASQSDQLEISARPPLPMDAILSFHKSAMQIGLIIAVGLVITANSWNTSPGLSIFYRTRCRHLSPVVLSRMLVAYLAGIAAYGISVPVVCVLTRILIGSVELEQVLRLWFFDSVYMVLAGAIGFVLVALTRNTTTAISITFVLLLLLPVVGEISALASWFPTGLLNSTTTPVHDLIVPSLVTIGLAAAFISTGLMIMSRQTLKRSS